MKSGEWTDSLQQYISLQTHCESTERGTAQVTRGYPTTGNHNRWWFDDEKDGEGSEAAKVGFSEHNPVITLQDMVHVSPHESRCRITHQVEVCLGYDRNRLFNRAPIEAQQSTAV